MKKEFKINILAVTIGGMCGGAARFLISQVTQDATSFWGTTIVNLLGCFLLAFNTVYFTKNSQFPDWAVLGINTGFIGSFTTFSTLMLHVGHDAIGLAVQISLLAINIVFGFILAWLGSKCAMKITEGKRK